MVKQLRLPVAMTAPALLFLSSCHPWPRSSQERLPAGNDADDMSQYVAEPFSLESFEKFRPSFGIQITGSPGALGRGSIAAAEQGAISQAILLEAEYQPSFLQKFGVIGIGPSIGIYPTGNAAKTGQPVTPPGIALYSYGGQLRYQFRYWDQQILVPSLSYEIDQLHYSIMGGGSGQLTLAGGSLGLEFFMNRVEPTGAAEFFNDFGVARTYLVAQIKSLAGNDANVAVAGSSYFFGLRFEF